MTQSEFLIKAARARKFGTGLVDDFAYDNLIMGFNLSQRIQIISELKDVIDALNIGAIDIAIYHLQNLAPVPVILEQDRIDEYTGKLINLAGNL